MESVKIFDNLHLSNDNQINTIINSEKIYFSDFVKKLNHFRMVQDRILILTDKALYNIKNKNKTLKRRISFDEILGITYSSLSFEFIIHGLNNEYDYAYITPERTIIICLIAYLYEQINKKLIKICEINKKSSLKDFTTSKKDKKNDSTKTKMNEKYLVDTKEFLDKYASVIYGTALKINKRSSTIFSKHSDIKTVQLSDFKIIKVIGRGSFGKVCLVQYIKTKEYYAMKSMKKDVLLDQEQIECALLEKQILQTLNHPFLIGMVFCFQTEERIYFITPFIRGGELFQHLQNEKHFSEEKAKFYAAIIGIALEYLHNHGIIYRDIKPENILLDEDGYLKLADFGMAKILEGDEKANSFCGTPEYLAPEIITGEGHGKGADWWSYGILLYEMIIGIPPFYSEHEETMYQIILQSDVRFPKKLAISDEAKDLIRRLLIKDQEIRLGNDGGFEKIKQHPFFEGFDFKALLEKKLKAPFKPIIKSDIDVSNFDKEFTSEDTANSIIPEKNLKMIRENQEQFEDFSK